MENIKSKKKKKKKKRGIKKLKRKERRDNKKADVDSFVACYSSGTPVSPKSGVPGPRCK
jgi:hypothetical protein